MHNSPPCPACGSMMDPDTMKCPNLQCPNHQDAQVPQPGVCGTCHGAGKVEHGDVETRICPDCQGTGVPQ